MSEKKNTQNAVSSEDQVNALVEAAQNETPKEALERILAGTNLKYSVWINPKFVSESLRGALQIPFNEALIADRIRRHSFFDPYRKLAHALMKAELVREAHLLTQPIYKRGTDTYLHERFHGILPISQLETANCFVTNVLGAKNLSEERSDGLFAQIWQDGRPDSIVAMKTYFSDNKQLKKYRAERVLDSEATQMRKEMAEKLRPEDAKYGAKRTEFYHVDPDSLAKIADEIESKAQERDWERKRRKAQKRQRVLDPRLKRHMDEIEAEEEGKPASARRIYGLGRFNLPDGSSFEAEIGMLWGKGRKQPTQTNDGEGPQDGEAPDGDDS